MSRREFKRKFLETSWYRYFLDLYQEGVLALTVVTPEELLRENMLIFRASMLKLAEKRKTRLLINSAATGPLISLTQHPNQHLQDISYDLKNWFLLQDLDADGLKSLTEKSTGLMKMFNALEKGGILEAVATSNANSKSSLLPQ